MWLRPGVCEMIQIGHVSLWAAQHTFVYLNTCVTMGHLPGGMISWVIGPLVMYCMYLRIDVVPGIIWLLMDKGPPKPL